MQLVCLLGAFPSEPLPLGVGGSETLRLRWSRWLALSGGHLAHADPAEGRTWRFATAAGIFEATPVAGVWRMSRTRAEVRLPLALLTQGAIPAAGDPWFDAAADLLAEAVEGIAPLSLIQRRMEQLPRFAPAAPPDAAAVFWIDDWEVHEFRFATIHDLAAKGFACMLAQRPVSEEA